MIKNLNKDTVLSYISPIDITLKELGLQEIPNKNISSPFKEDKTPSFKIYPNGNFKCFCTGKNGDCFQLVAELNDLDCKNEFQKVLQLIATKYNIWLQPNTFSIQENNKIPENKGLKPSISVIEEVADKVATPFTLKIEKIKFEKQHLDFWKKYGVGIDVLEKYKVSAISSYSFFSENKNKDLNFNLKENEIGFSYEVNGNFEVYIPKQKTRNKTFCNGLTAEDIFGLEQLPEKVESLIICAGKKDTLVATSFGFYAVTFRSETQTPSKEQIKMLKSRCNHLFICYDNDNGGELGAKRIVENHDNIIQLQLPEDVNDVADFFEKYKTEDFEKIINDAMSKKSTSVNFDDYVFPVEIQNPEKYINDIKKYSLFMANNQIWIATISNKKTNFKSVSNFEIKILQHIQDEKHPMKLISIRNVHNKECVFDIQSERINTPQKLDDTITSYGNFLWYGSPKEFHLLRAFLFDNMKVGKKIECLGWNNEFKFWVWNNKIKLPSNEEIEIDKNGLFEYKNTSIYIPSANQVYANNSFKFETQKKFILKYPKLTFEKYLEKFYLVFKDNCTIALLFSLSSIYQDIIVKSINGFPILFLQGIPSTGKDQLAICCQSFFGEHQASINVEAGVSTAKAHIREFAQFTNSICQFSEYRTGDRQLDGILKGIWDRNGYKRGTIESNVATDTVPILSSLLLTGNQTPDDEALITRLIWLEMNKTAFTPEEIKNYDELKELTQNGISSYTDALIQYREHYLSNFKKVYQKNKANINTKFSNLESRFSTNYAILLTTYEILSDKIDFPFTYNEAFDLTIELIKNQRGKLSAVGISEKWWNCFVMALQTTNQDNKIAIDKDFKLEGDNLYFNFTQVYNKIQRVWLNQYRTSAPNSRTVQGALKREKSFINSISSTRIGENNTSAYQFDANLTPIKNEIINYSNCNQSNSFPTIPTNF